MSETNNYIIELRPSPHFIESLYELELKELAELLGRSVLLARTISCQHGPEVEEVRAMAREAAVESLRSLPPEVQIQIDDRLEVSERSIIIVIFVTVVVLPHVAAAGAVGVGIGTLGVWAAGKFFGGTFEEWGKKFADKLAELFTGWRKGKGNDKPEPIVITNPQEIADLTALSVAAQHGCGTALLAGGIDIGDQTYRYTYLLTRCKLRTITVDIDAHGKRPPQFNVTE